MSTTTLQAASAPSLKSLEEFTRELNTEHRMMGQWQDEEMLKSMMCGAKRVGEDMVWTWSTNGSKLTEACDVLPESMGARRSLLMLKHK